MKIEKKGEKTSSLLVLTDSRVIDYTCCNDEASEVGRKYIRGKVIVEAIHPSCQAIKKAFMRQLDLLETATKSHSLSPNFFKILNLFFFNLLSASVIRLQPSWGTNLKD